MGFCDAVGCCVIFIVANGVGIKPGVAVWGGVGLDENVINGVGEASTSVCRGVSVGRGEGAVTDGVATVSAVGHGEAVDQGVRVALGVVATVADAVLWLSAAGVNHGALVGRVTAVVVALGIGDSEAKKSVKVIAGCVVFICGCKKPTVALGTVGVISAFNEGAQPVKLSIKHKTSVLRANSENFINIFLK